MKKTTYILIGFIVLAIVAAFFLPPMLFKSRSASVILANEGMSPAKTTNSFSSLSISYEKYPRLLDLPMFEITETDSATAPTITLSKGLDENARIETAGDTLAIVIDLHTSAHGDLDGHNVSWVMDSLPAAVLTVPRGMLKNISATDAEIKLNGFSAPVRFSASTEMILDRCEIPIMEICRSGKASIDLRGSSKIGKLDVTDSDISVNGDENSAIDTLVTRSCYDSSDIYSRKSTIKTIINESNNNTTIHIAGAGKVTIK